MILKEAGYTEPTGISPDGKLLVYTESTIRLSTDIKILSLDGSGDSRIFLSTSFVESQAVVSPDCKWLA